MESTLLSKAAQQQEQLHRAATLIQTHYRRHAARKHFQQLRRAATNIQQHARSFLCRREAAQTHERDARAMRFKAVMARHRERIQQLELEKQRLRDLPCDQMDAQEAHRQTAANLIQAYWRGSKQREALRAKHPGLLILRPPVCQSPTLPEGRVQSSKRQKQSSGQHTLTTADSAGITSEPSTAADAGESIAAGSPAACASARSHRTSGVSTSYAAGHLWGEPSSTSTMLTCEASKLSAVTAAAVESASGPKRSSALPATRQMVLERQVQMRINAFKAAHSGSSRLAALKTAKDITDQRLVQLLQDRQAAAARHLRGVRRRQKLLQKSEVLYNHLQQLPQLSQLASAANASQLPIFAADIAVTERARQAHALALAEAKVGSKWWLPLKVLNQQARDAAIADDGSHEQQGWEQQHAAWKQSWARIFEKERRPDAQSSSRQQECREVVVEQELTSESSWHAAA